MSRIQELVAQVTANEPVGTFIASNDLTRGLVQRIAGGETADEAMLMVHDLADAGRHVTLDRAWQSGDSLEQTVAEYELMLTLLGASGLGSIADVVVPAALLDLPRGPEALHELCAAATDASATIMLATGRAESIDASLDLVERQAAVGRRVGIVLQAALKRTESDCDRVHGAVRLVKSSVDVREGGRYGQQAEIDKSYVRCAKALLRRGDAVRPSFATHDARLVGIVENLGGRYGRAAGDLEFAFYLGRNGSLQQRLIDAGEDVRVYVPFGRDWVGRLIGGLSERPRGLGSALRSVLPGNL